jgi:hypothetical protein
LHEHPYPAEVSKKKIFLIADADKAKRLLSVVTAAMMGTTHRGAYHR